MNNTVLLIALAGLTTAASAEDFILSMEGPSVVDGSSVFTIDIIGDSTFGTHMMTGTFGIVNTGDQVVTDMTWSPASWSSFNTDHGHAGGGNYNQVVVGQLILPDPPPLGGPHPDSGLGSSVGSFQITMDTDMEFWEIDLNFVTFGSFTLEVLDYPGGSTQLDTSGNLILNGITISNSVPAPSVLALLGLGGLAIGRRRR